MGLVYERLQHQRKSVHVEVPPYGIFCQLAIGAGYIYAKILYSVLQPKAKKVKKSAGKHERLMNNL